MASIDGKNDLKILGSVAPQAVTADVNGSSVDTLGFESVTLHAYGDGTFVGTVKIQHSDDNSTWTDAASTEVIGTQDNAVDTTDTVVTIGYIGPNRYVRAVATHTTDGDLSVGFALGRPQSAPVTGND